MAAISAGRIFLAEEGLRTTPASAISAASPRWRQGRP